MNKYQAELEAELIKIGEVSRVTKTMEAHFGVNLDKDILRNVPKKCLPLDLFMGVK